MSLFRTRSSRLDLPPRWLPITTLEWGLEAAALLGVAALLWSAATTVPQVTDRVPRHFNASGQADAWGPASGLWILPCTAVGIYLLVTFVSRFPRLFNFPVVATNENAELLFRLSREMSAWLKFEIVWVFLYIYSRQVALAGGVPGGLGRAFTPLFLVLIFGTIIIYARRMRQA